MVISCKILKKDEWAPIVCDKLGIKYDKVTDIKIAALLGNDELNIYYEE